ncbi:MAG: PIN domain-containing protein [Chloroflexi bacterium]|nr:PIN domain-containing protein [Chloroflexota bacterium]
MAEGAERGIGTARRGSVRPGARGPRALTLDAGGLIAIEQGDGDIRAVLELAKLHGILVYVPAPVVVEVWRGGSGRQARLAAFFNTGLKRGDVQVISLDLSVARMIGALLAHAQADDVGVADAMVAWCALQYDSVVYTSDPRHLARLLPPERLRLC